VEWVADATETGSIKIPEIQKQYVEDVCTTCRSTNMILVFEFSWII
jgi:hypothetical protein